MLSPHSFRAYGNNAIMFRSRCVICFCFDWLFSLLELLHLRETLALSPGPRPWTQSCGGLAPGRGPLPKDATGCWALLPLHPFKSMKTHENRRTCMKSYENQWMNLPTIPTNPCKTHENIWESIKIYENCKKWKSMKIHRNWYKKCKSAEIYGM